MIIKRSFFMSNFKEKPILYKCMSLIAISKEIHNTNNSLSCSFTKAKHAVYMQFVCFSKHLKCFVNKKPKSKNRYHVKVLRFLIKWCI